VSNPTSAARSTEWRRPRPPAAAQWRDLAIAIALAIGGVFGTELGRALGQVPDLGAGGVEVYLWSAVIALPLALRRRYPIAVMVTVALIFFIAGERHEIAVMSNLVVQADLFVAIYSAHAWARDRQRLMVATVVVVVGMFSWLVYGFVKALQLDVIEGSEDALLSPYVSYVLLQVAINVAYFFGAFFWGRTTWRNARQRDMLERQATELARQHEENARRAVVDERLRISRELHDVVAHHISSIGVQAGGARRVLEKDPEASKAALSTIENSSRRAVAEMRQLLGTLRLVDNTLNNTLDNNLDNTGDGPADEAGTPTSRSPQAGVGRLPELVRELTAESAHTLNLTYREIGRPRELPETVSVSLYRVAQEALTNIRRHSTARTGQVTLRYLAPGNGSGNGSGPDEGAECAAVEVEVIDDGRPNNAPSGSGLGHVGIRERVALHGGETEIGPRPVGGYRVRARFPLEETP